MGRVLEAADRYVKDCTWKDMALLKFCLAALGVLLGLAVPPRKKRPAIWIAAIVFAAAYVPLMAKFLPFLLGKRAAEEELSD